MSKTLLYDFHYSYMKRRLGEKCKLLYTDTDSLIYEVDDVDMYKIMKEDLHKFDTSDYKENNQFGIPRVNKKVPGLMKDECNGKIMTEFIGLRSKMYSILIDGSETVKKAKGIKSSVVKKTITFEDYRKCLEEQIIVKREQCNIRSKLHIVHTEKQNKIALSPHDDKRYLLPHSTDTLPWGHYRIIEVQMALAVSQMEEDEKMADTRGERVGEMELEQGYEATNTKEESERAMERGSELSNENSAARVGMTLYGDTGEQIFIEYDVCEELMHEWNPSMEGASSNRRDILQEAMEGADIVVGNGYMNRRTTVKSTFEQSSLKITYLWRRNQDSLNIFKMDLSALNKIAEREFLPKKKVTDLEKDHEYMVMSRRIQSFRTKSVRFNLGNILGRKLPGRVLLLFTLAFQQIGRDELSRVV
ncbi:uncharacterized protein LOC116417229 [Nasonia vitripennis]|uniref:DNA-directed DNA polymerase n=1 Tax=Nasonia vitripennis TaxID=7425 RepID=A0A7M7QC07_NASVI|nr:uncharacterized protein LOC116417229 [Nasonia vitripennis]